MYLYIYTHVFIHADPWRPKRWASSMRCGLWSFNCKEVGSWKCPKTTAHLEEFLKKNVFCCVLVRWNIFEIYLFERDLMNLCQEGTPWRSCRSALMLVLIFGGRRSCVNCIKCDTAMACTRCSSTFWEMDTRVTRAHVTNMFCVFDQTRICHAWWFILCLLLQQLSN